MIYSFDFIYGFHFLIISSVGLILLFSLLLFTCLFGSCWIPSCFKGTTVEYLKKAAIKPTPKTEDNFYLSEVSSSRDSLSSSAGSTLSIKSDTAISVLSEINSNSLPVKLQQPPFVSTHKANGNSPDNSKPVVFIKLQYINVGDQNGKLHVSIKNVTSLPAKEFPRYTEIYVILTAKCQKTTLKGRHENLLRIYQTKPFRNTRSTDLDEHFVIEGKSADIKYWKFLVSVYEEDLYTKPTELASTSISLAEKAKQLINNSSEWVNLICNLQPISNNVGNILVGLSYLPTSQRLSVSIIKLANLNTNIGTPLRPYVQLHLLAGVIGRSLKKKKLMFEPSSDPFELNGNVSFDILPSSLATITLLIVLFNRVRINKDQNTTYYNEKTNEMDEIEYVDECIGHLVLGNLVTGIKEKKHWTMMISLPRRVVTVWHTLK